MLVLSDYSRPLHVCLAFLAASPNQRAELLPDVWRKPVSIDNGYAFRAEQPRHVMADFCGEWLRLQELWEEVPAYTGLALQPPEVQARAEAQLERLRARVQGLDWRDWAESEADCEVALKLLEWLNWPADLPPEKLYAELDRHTYGTFSAALQMGKPETQRQERPHLPH